MFRDFEFVTEHTSKPNDDDCFGPIEEEVPLETDAVAEEADEHVPRLTLRTNSYKFLFNRCSPPVVCVVHKPIYRQTMGMRRTVQDVCQTEHFLQRVQPNKGDTTPPSMKASRINIHRFGTSGTIQVQPTEFKSYASIGLLNRNIFKTHTKDSIDYQPLQSQTVTLSEAAVDGQKSKTKSHSKNKSSNQRSSRFPTLQFNSTNRNSGSQSRSSRFSVREHRDVPITVMEDNDDLQQSGQAPAKAKRLLRIDTTVDTRRMLLKSPDFQEYLQKIQQDEAISKPSVTFQIRKHSMVGMLN